MVDPLGFIDIHSVVKYKIEAGPFGAIENFSEKSLIVSKKSKS